MATKHRRPSIAGHRAAAALLLIVLHLFSAAGIQAQPPPIENNNSSRKDNPDYLTSAKFSPSMAIIIAVILGSFLLIGFFSIYFRQCGEHRLNSLAQSAAARSRRLQGLDPTILETFPTLVYAEVKEHKVGKGALECAICLNEFEDEDAIRLLPNCDHVFHQDCIDAWLATHVTCPVCRSNYAFNSVDAPPLPAAMGLGPARDPRPPPIGADDGERKEEMKELARIASKVRRSGSRRGAKLPRWHSTGNLMAQQGVGVDRFTLRLPEDVRKDVIAAGMLQRGSSLAAMSVVREESGRRGRSGRLGRSDRWSTSLARTVSANIPVFGRGKFAGGGFFKKNADGDEDDSESSTAALNRV